MVRKMLEVNDNMEVKGRTFTITVEFIKQKFGIEKLSSFYADFPKYKQIENFSEIDWYPAALFLELSEDADRYFGFGDFSFLEELGLFWADNALKTSHELFKNISPELFLSNGQVIFSSYYSPGTVKTNYLGERKAEINIENFGDSICLSKRILGWMKRILSASGSRKIKLTEIPAKNKMAFLLEWE